MAAFDRLDPDATASLLPLLEQRLLRRLDEVDWRLAEDGLVATTLPAIQALVPLVARVRAIAAEGAWADGGEACLLRVIARLDRILSEVRRQAAADRPLAEV